MLVSRLVHVTHLLPLVTFDVIPMTVGHLCSILMTTSYKYIPASECTHARTLQIIIFGRGTYEGRNILADEFILVINSDHSELFESLKCLEN